MLIYPFNTSSMVKHIGKRAAKAISTVLYLPQTIRTITDNFVEFYVKSILCVYPATEQRARRRAAQNVQANIAATIAWDFKARLDITDTFLVLLL
jgi:F0F1-type ATP synthase gamma subunit